MMFEDDTISIIPKRNILDEVAVHQSCTVKWTGGKRYQAEILFVDMSVDCEAKTLMYPRIVFWEEPDHTSELFHAIIHAQKITTKIGELACASRILCYSPLYDK